MKYMVVVRGSIVSTEKKQLFDIFGSISSLSIFVTFASLNSALRSDRGRGSRKTHHNPIANEAQEQAGTDLGTRNPFC